MSGEVGAANEVEQAWRVAIVERRLPADGRGNLPTFWPDVDVRRFLIVQHGFMTLDMAREAIVRRYGLPRAPSRSAIHRFWQKLDKVSFAQ